MLLKSNKGSGNLPPLQNIINDNNLEEFAYDDEEKCDLLNKYFSFISKLDEANAHFTGEPRFVIISNNNCLGWNTLPCQSEKCFGKLITHVIYILNSSVKLYLINLIAVDIIDNYSD
jgi:hypothetical protein